ncbi:2-oxo-4-hydroxy-4-carboxy-5-ureidoimidazoline decarboxylase [Nocardia aurea]|uniref:2-oxo-4-hydroxy-4-carboxy-5-ureidoimidazoline decarboxylase n=1 Tax=Nocardia aurea TaxID=2144174 RepID=UPI0033A319AF
MLMHRGIGLDRFNSLPRTRAVHAMYTCCGNVTWATRIVEARPFADHDALLNAADLELLQLSQTDLDRALSAVGHEHLGAHTVTELTKVTRDRIERMLGPEEGYPEY